MQMTKSQLYIGRVNSRHKFFSNPLFIGNKTSYSIDCHKRATKRVQYCFQGLFKLINHSTVNKIKYSIIYSYNILTVVSTHSAN